ncbi:MAG: CPBP family intramembrane metalloprotease domain-containing protein [Phenylobacterium zucineum]|nr:MAG: CPBP family intramembrane metalloprotease domain-containing protein [Phenylobacterium zucineum]
MPLPDYRHPWRFYVPATLVPWIAWFTAGWLSRQPESRGYIALATLLGLAGLFFPMVLAGVMIVRQPQLLADVRARIFGFHRGQRQYVWLAFGLMPASILLAQAVSLIFGYSPDQFYLSGHTSFTGGLVPGWFMLVLAPMVEELAWHSYGTDSLRQRLNLLNTSLLFGIFWAIWHAPLGGIRGYYHANTLQQGWIYSANFALSLIPFTLLMNWIYYKSGRSITAAIVFHISAGLANEALQTHPDSKIIQTFLLMIMSAILVYRDPEFFCAANRSRDPHPSPYFRGDGRHG